MKIQVVLLGQYREARDANEFTLELPAGSTAASAVRLVRAGGNTVIPPEPVVAINYEQSSLDTVLQDGDEVALLPPVAGG
jgi:molybdopterin converting factor small subunit